MKLISKLQFQKPISDGIKILKREATENFERQGGIYDGKLFSAKPWAKLANSTKKDRARQGYNPSRPILERTGKLKRGFKENRTSQTEGSLENFVSYAKYHQFGTKKMPRRQVIGSSKRSRTAIGLVIANFIGQKIREVNLN